MKQNKQLTEKEMYNKITYDDNCNEDDYTVGYLDNIKKELIFVNYFDIITEIGNKFNFFVDEDGKEKEIPFHRIKEFKKKGRVIWKRKWK